MRKVPRQVGSLKTSFSFHFLHRALQTLLLKRLKNNDPLFCWSQWSCPNLFFCSKSFWDSHFLMFTKPEFNHQNNVPVYLFMKAVKCGTINSIKFNSCFLRDTGLNLKVLQTGLTICKIWNKSRVIVTINADKVLLSLIAFLMNVA